MPQVNQLVQQLIQPFKRLGSNRNPRAYTKGLIPYRQKQWSQAVEYFTQATVEQPDHAPSHFKLGMSHFRLKEYDAALEAMARAKKLDPSQEQWMAQIEQAKRHVVKQTDQLPSKNYNFKSEMVHERQSAPYFDVKVSVIVPIYNVEKYLPDCLDSILAQTHNNLEIICVDDGSPDNSINVLRAYEAKDRRIKVVRKPNGGLGAARNTGVESSTGTMICFVDSDDTIPPRAIELLLKSLVKSGSDFVVGSLMHDTSSGRYVPNWAQKLHSHSRTSLTLENEPGVLKNVFAWTKMFRRQFFLDVIEGFPDGLYEDQVPSAKAYAHGTFDIIKDVVCYWKIRDDESSITQQKATMKDLTGRLEVISSLAVHMRNVPSPVFRAWQAKAVGFDLRPYYKQVPRTEDEYWEHLRDFVRSFIDSAGYEVLANVPEITDRLLAAATYHGYRGDVTELLCRRESQSWKVPGTVENGIPIVAAEYFEGLNLRPDGVIEVLNSPDNITLAQHIESIVITDSELIIRGSAYLKNLSMPRKSSNIFLVATPLNARHDNRGYEIHSVLTTRYIEPSANVRAADPWNDHSESGFVAVFCLADLAQDHWNFNITVDINGVSLSAPLAAPDSRASGRLPAFGAQSKCGERWYVIFNRATDCLQLSRTVVKQFAVGDAWAEDNCLSAQLDEPIPQEEGNFVAISSASIVVGSIRVRNRQPIVSFHISATTQHNTDWTFWWQSKNQRIQLAWADNCRQVSEIKLEPFLVRSSPDGGIIVQTKPLIGGVTGAVLCKGNLKVTGWFRRDVSLAATQVSARLFNQYVPSVTVPIDAMSGKFEVSFPLVDATGKCISNAHGYAVVLEAEGAGQVWLRATKELLSCLPIEAEQGGIGMTLSVTPKARALWIRFRNSIVEHERSRRSQHLLQNSYRSEHSPIDAVLFESFNGKSVGDSPLALSRELQRRGSNLIQYWSVESLTTSVPEWATPLLRYSKDWYEVLAAARLLINNNNWPWFFTKRPYQTYLQTWHGTPLKKIANDMPNKSSLTLTYRSLMQREAEAWDYLLAQNDYSARILPQAFGFSGSVIQLGYPRNDSLVDETAQSTRDRVRSALGLGDDIQVLLYAPTWRDNLKGVGGYSQVSFLDFNVLRSGAHKKIIVLFRGHSNTVNALGVLPDGVLDVTRYPNLNDLMLASDVLVTDYSSIFFDYAVMQKPIYFLVPDLEKYCNTTRGFYVPLEEIAPGPLCLNTESLVYELNQDYEYTYGNKLQHFLDKYASQDDGYSASRVLNTLKIS